MPALTGRPAAAAASPPPTELTATGDDTSLQTWDADALAAFAGAALDLLQQAQTLDVKEKALVAMRTLLMRRGAAGGSALAQRGAEAVLREELVQLDLLASRLGEEAAAAGAGAGAVPAASPDDAEADADDEAAAKREEQQFAGWVATLCADVLHQLAVHHDEL